MFTDITFWICAMVKNTSFYKNRILILILEFTNFKRPIIIDTVFILKGAYWNLENGVDEDQFKIMSKL